jgi:hypothetical protein
MVTIMDVAFRSVYFLNGLPEFVHICCTYTFIYCDHYKIQVTFPAAFPCRLENNLETAAAISWGVFHHLHITITGSVKMV